VKCLAITRRQDRGRPRHREFEGIEDPKMIRQLNFSRAQLVDFCQRWKIAKMALFGSVLRDDFRPDSDVDVLVSFSSEAHYTLLDLARMESELEKIFGRRVDLVELSAIEKSRNYIRRKSILSSAETIYAG